jgi:hypothetical protein
MPVSIRVPSASWGGAGVSPSTGEGGDPGDDGLLRGGHADMGGGDPRQGREVERAHVLADRNSPGAPSVFTADERVASMRRRGRGRAQLTAPSEDRA